MKIFSYIVVRDLGFAPNPFGGYCTLATCKPSIRKKASVGDWVVGTTSVSGHKRKGGLVFAMRVDEKLLLNQYWNDKRFEYKKPRFNGSLIQAYGDNIYYQDTELKNWQQANSHHSLKNGLVNLKNLKNDVTGMYVLISQTFFYFGRSFIRLPIAYQDLICNTKRFPLHIEIEKSKAQSFINWLTNNHQEGFQDKPYHLHNDFSRFTG